MTPIKNTPNIEKVQANADEGNRADAMRQLIEELHARDLAAERMTQIEASNPALSANSSSHTVEQANAIGEADLEAGSTKEIAAQASSQQDRGESWARFSENPIDNAAPAVETDTTDPELTAADLQRQAELGAGGIRS